LARKKIDCGPPVELSNPRMLAYINQKCHICEECGEKSHWPGAKNESGVYPLRINQKTYSVRRVVYELNGKKLQKGGMIVTKCHNHRCMNTALFRQVRMDYIVREAQRAGTLRTKAINRKIAETKRLAGKITQDAADSIRMDDRRSADVAAEHGISDSYVRAIRAGHARKCYAVTPFAGLMG